MAEKLIVSWDEYNKIVEALAIQIHNSGYKPTLLVGIMRGGAPMIDVLSRVFKLKCAYLAVESYSGKGVEDEQGNIVFSREMSSIAKNMGGKILLCDDLSDTGITLNKNMVPFDPKSPFITSGVRIGSPALTTRGMGLEEVKIIANLIDKVIMNSEDKNIINSVRKEVKELCQSFPIY